MWFNLFPTWLVAAVAAFFIGLGLGWRHEAIKFDEYQAKVEAQAKAQAEKTAEIEARHVQQTKEVSDAYKRRLADVRARYERLYPNTAHRAVSKTGDTTGGTDEYTPDHLPDPGLLASDCAATTVQLITLQDWVNETSKE